MFALQNTPAADRLALEGLQCFPLTEDGTAKFDLTLDVFDMGSDGLQAEFEYSSDLFDPETVARMVGIPARAAGGSRPFPNRQSAGSVVPEEAESERRLEPGRPVDAFGQPVHEAVADWARRTPEARPCAGTAAS